MITSDSQSAVQGLRKGLVALTYAGALIVSFLVAPPQAVAADTPYLDPAFGERGRAVVDFGGQGANAVAVDVDLQGRTVTVGLPQDENSHHFLQVMRLLQTGEPDLAFGQGGVATFRELPYLADEEVRDDGTLSVHPDVSDVKVQDDGKVLVLSQRQLMRLDEHGALDETFGASGYVAPGPSGDNNFQQNNIFSYFDTAADGTIVVVGTATVFDGARWNQEVAGWRYTADGVLASSFAQFPVDSGNPDIIWTPQAMALDGAGRVVVAGAADGIQGRLLRFLPDGQLDSSFGEGGLVRQPSPGREVAAYPDGRIVVVRDQRINAYNADGTLLTDLAAPREMQIASLHIDGANRVLLAGTKVLQSTGAYALVRLNAEWMPDRSFGTNGVVMSTFPEGDAYMADATLTPDGDMVATGRINSFGDDPRNPVESYPYGWARYDLGRGPAFGYPAMRNDFNGDGRTDVLARDSSGVLWLYSGNGSGGFLTRTRVGGGWNVMTAIAGAPDLNTDGKADAVARDSSGVLWFYPGTGKGIFGTRVKIGGGWNVMTALAAAEDFNDDGKADLLARDRTGVMWSYRGNGKGGFPTRAKVSSGWNPMTAIAPGEDRKRDGRADVLARDRNGVLWFYPGDGAGGLQYPLRVGAGWNGMTAIVGTGDFNSERREVSGWVGDGWADVIARDTSGVLWFYPGNGRGEFGPRRSIGSGWNVMTAIS